MADCLYRQRLKATALVLNTISQQMNTVVSGDESEIHDDPHIRDRRITVSHIHAIVEELGLDTQTVDDPDIEAPPVHVPIDEGQTTVAVPLAFSKSIVSAGG